MKIENLKNKFLLFREENYGKDGINFEEIIIEQFWNNTFSFISFPENNKLKIEEIYKLKNNHKDKNNNLDISKPIIIRNTLFKSKYYDLLLIISQNDKIYAIFIQIGLNEDNNQISSSYKNISENIEKYKNGIETLLNHSIDLIGFIVIFDYYHQKNYLKQIKKSNIVGYCLDNNIDFLLYKDGNII